MKTTDWFKAINAKANYDMSHGEEESLRKQLLQLLNGTESGVIRSKTKAWESDTANSVVVSLPSLDINKIVPDDYKEIAFNLIHIKGKTEESLHYHTSHIFGLVLSGSGILYYGDETSREKAKTIEVVTGDILVVPKNSYHIFDCPDSELITVAVELSDVPIDYQSHYK